MSKDTLQLPKTAFSMKASLPLKEPEILKKWEKNKIFDKLRKKSKGKEKFILHDGPPYANGHIHMGTALNKILKDIITRFHQMNGKDSVYVPGWDCHGLPIEWKIEEQYKKKKKNKDEVPIKDFRQECREFAKSWIEVHIKEFKRLGVVGDFENYYSTMSFEAEAQIVRELGKFLLDGSLYQGFKPVLWSTVEKTALADAEVEYLDHTSNTIYVSFKVKETNKDFLKDSSIIIWTTTPWTIPANKALAFNSNIEYAVLEINKLENFKDKRIVVAKNLIETIIKDCEIKNYKEFWGKIKVYHKDLNDRLTRRRRGYQGLIYREAVERIQGYIESTADINHIFIGFNALSKSESEIIQEIISKNGKIYWDIDKEYLNSEYNLSLIHI